MRTAYGYLEKLLISPTSSLCSEFYPRNIKYMPVVKFFERVEFERILLIFKIPLCLKNYKMPFGIGGTFVEPRVNPPSIFIIEPVI